MPLNLWGTNRREIWRTCGCLHVRTVTIFIGVWYLMLYILALSFMTALLVYDDPNLGKSVRVPISGNEQFLPTPLSKSSDDPSYGTPSALTDYRTLMDRDEYKNNKIEQIRSGPWNLVFDTKRPNSQLILVNVCNMLITLLMVVGAVRGKPSYLMPFFILKVFEFCIFCLTMVSFFSYLPNVSEMIAKEGEMPYREELLKMDPQLLSLLTLVIIVGTVSLKAYVISVVWTCYKYLMLKNTVIRGVITYRDDDGRRMMMGGGSLEQGLLPDLPDYDTAINDPRYAKKPPTDPLTSSLPSSFLTLPPVGLPSSTLSIGSGVPPPPYSDALRGMGSNIEEEEREGEAVFNVGGDVTTTTDTTITVENTPAEATLETPPQEVEKENEAPKTTSSEDQEK